jgi:hypothetical protein
MRKLIAVACLTAVGVIVAGTDSSSAQDKDKPKFTISEVMQQAHKGGVLKAVQSGSASDEQKKQLVEYYTALTQNAPPAGDKDAWKKQTTAMKEAAEKAAKGDEKGVAELKKIVNCGNCHKMFKG